jgi:hypothetical protein
MIGTYRHARFQGQIRGQIEGVFNDLFGHVLDCPVEYRNHMIQTYHYNNEYAKIPSWIRKAFTFVQESIRNTSTFISPPWPKEITQDVLCRDDQRIDCASYGFGY